MTAPEWESVSTGRGAYIGWGQTPGQHVTGKVVSYGERSGTTPPPKSLPVPEVGIELTETAASFNKFGERTDHEPGTTVLLTASQKNLERGLLNAQPKPGDLLKITLEKLVPSGEGTAKVYDILIARGAGGPVEQAVQAQAQASSQATFGGQFDAEPPF